MCFRGCLCVVVVGFVEWNAELTHVLLLFISLTCEPKVYGRFNNSINSVYYFLFVDVYELQ